MRETVYALKGIIVHTPTFDSMDWHENEYVVCENGVSKGIFKELPEEYKDIKVYDYTDKFILPGMCDMHVHAPQYGFRGMGMLLENNSEWETWFKRYSLPEESRYKDLDYANLAYQRFVDDMVKTTTTTRACIFATIHRPATELLMQKLDDAGMSAFVGKLNMDRNSHYGYQETTEETISETEKWLNETMNAYKNVKPIITPRYTPTCTDESMEALGKMAEKYNVPVMSHLSEGLDEIEWVKSMKHDIECYGDAYDMYGMLGSTVPSLMAHCVFPDEKEWELMKNRNLTVAHCPSSNAGCANVARVLDMVDAGIKVGLGTDVAGQQDLSLMRAMTYAITVSKLRWGFVERNNDPFAPKRWMTIPNAFYLATMGGGQFFGKVGCFNEGYEFDAVVLDDSDLRDFVERPVSDRFQRVLWNHHAKTLKAKYVKGKLIYDRDMM